MGIREEVEAWDRAVWERWKWKVGNEFEGLGLEEVYAARERARLEEGRRRFAQALRSGVVADPGSGRVGELHGLFGARAVAVNRRIKLVGRVRLRAAMRG